MPVVKFFECLEIERISLFFKAPFGKRGTRLRDIKHMPVVKFFECLEIERISLFFKALWNLFS